jgi:hypothetical protein
MHCTSKSTRHADPHSSLPTNIPSIKDVRTFHRHVLETKTNRSDLDWTPAFTRIAFCRIVSAQALNLADIRLDSAHGSEEDGPRARMISYVVRSGAFHKDKWTNNHMVGNYRHREYLLCRTGHLAMTFISRFNLRTEDSNMHFYSSDGLKAPATSPWQELPRIIEDWKSYNSANTAYKKTCKDLGRDFGMDYGGSQCLDDRILQLDDGAKAAFQTLTQTLTANHESHIANT